MRRSTAKNGKVWYFMHYFFRGNAIFCAIIFTWMTCIGLKIMRNCNSYLKYRVFDKCFKKCISYICHVVIILSVYLCWKSGQIPFAVSNVPSPKIRRWWQLIEFQNSILDLAVYFKYNCRPRHSAKNKKTST